MMRQITCQKPEQFQLENINKPSLVENEAIIKMKYVGICGTDIHAYKGNQPFFTYPRILGHELSGEIVDVASDNPELVIGDKVTIIPYIHCGTCIACRGGKANCCTSMEVIGVHRDGGMREYLSVPIQNIIKVNEISLKKAAMIEPLSIGAHAVRRADISSNDTVLVIGVGPIGLGIMKFSKLAGAKVIAMDINAERLELVKKWGEVDSVINAAKHPKENMIEMTNGGLAPIVFDATGNKQSMNYAINYVSHGGKLVFVGLIKDDISFYHPHFHKKEMSVIGSRNATLEDFEYVISCMKEKKIDVSRYITKEVEFNHVIEQFPSITNPNNNEIKAIVKL